MTVRAPFPGLGVLSGEESKLAVGNAGETPASGFLVVGASFVSGAVAFPLAMNTVEILLVSNNTISRGVIVRATDGARFLIGSTLSC